MTDEEKKAIETLEKFKKYGFYKLQLETGDNRARTTCLIENSISSILTLIEKQEKELHKLKNQAEISAKARIELTENQDAIIEKLEKVIDEMTKYIEHTCYYVDECGNYCDIKHDACYKYDKNCNECIKQYFYRKVKTK